MASRLREMQGDGGTMPNLGQSQLNLSDEDKDIKKAFRKLSVTNHPDKGGNTADTQTLLAAKDAWQNAQKIRQKAQGQGGGEAGCQR